MKKTDLAYLAGIIDGEGSISIRHNATRTCRLGYRLTMSVQVNSSDEWLCHWLQVAYPGHLRSQMNPYGTLMFHWTIVGQQATAMLRDILPYLRLKAPQAIIALAFQANKKRSGGRKSDTEMAIEEAQRIALTALHSSKGKLKEGQ